MLADHPSRGTINNPEQPDVSPYVTLQSHGQYIRVLGRELLCHRALVRIWAVFWSFISLTLGVLIICSVEQTGVLMIVCSRFQF